MKASDIALLVIAIVLVPIGGVLACVDSALARYINAIRAIDNHAHPMRPIPDPAGAPDTDFDALPLDGIPAFDMPSRLRADDPIWRAAQSALYDVAPSLTRAAAVTAAR